MAYPESAVEDPPDLARVAKPIGSGRDLSAIVGRRDTNSGRATLLQPRLSPVQGSYVAEGRKIVVRFIRRRREGSNGSRRCIVKPFLTIAHRRAASGADTRTGLRRQLVALL